MRKIALILSAMAACISLSAQQQLYNLDFDTWSRKGACWNPFPKDADASTRVWDTANKGLSILGINGTEPEYEHVAVTGPGKAAAKLSGKKAAGTFCGGNLYTGRFVKVVKFTTADMYLGTPFKGRPVSLSGYYHYKPGVIDCARGEYKNRKGTLDAGNITVTLTDWDSPHHLTVKGDGQDSGRDPHLIGEGSLVFKKETPGYVHFEMPIKYYNDRQPKYILILMSTSLYSEFFTGSTKSVLYVDEFKLNYK